MMLKEIRDNIEIILVEPESPGNIGSCARAMRNMGFNHLGLVNPVDYQVLGAHKMAWNSREILDAAVVYPDVRSAVANKGFVVAMTRRQGKDRGFIELLNEYATEILQRSTQTKVAILFGRESRGLENEELQYANQYVRLHTAGDFASLNLAQAVLLTCYELLGTGGIIPDERPKPSEQEDLEKCYDHIRIVLEKLGYGVRGSRVLPDIILGNLRKIAGRAVLDYGDLQMIRGLCASVEKLAENSEPSRSE